MVPVPPDPRRLAPWLWLLWFAFVVRVGGQMLVACGEVDWLLPMDSWMSGLMPYPYLLPAQWTIVIVFALICRDFRSGRGWFLKSLPAFRKPALCFGYLYFAGMIVRYVVTMWVRPEQRWFGGTIPIFFHWVLAAYLFVCSRHHERAAAA